MPLQKRATWRPAGTNENTTAAASKSTRPVAPPPKNMVRLLSGLLLCYLYPHAPMVHLVQPRQCRHLWHQAAAHNYHHLHHRHHQHHQHDEHRHHGVVHEHTIANCLTTHRIRRAATATTKPFESWVQRKDAFDRGVELLARLGTRWESDDEYQKMTKALCAIDESLGVDAEEAVKTTASSGPARNMFDIYKRKSMGVVALTFVTITAKEASNLSETVKSYASEKEVTLRSGEKKTVLELPQVRYNYPAVPPNKSAQVKPLTKDQKVQNAIFLKTIRRRWMQTHQEVVAAAGKLSVRLLEEYLKQRENDAAEAKDGTVEPVEHPSAEDLKARALHIMGIRKLSKWVEEDNERKEEEEKESKDTKREEARMAHDAFVRGKKNLEIWMPDEEASSKAPHKQPPRFIFATGGRRNPAVPLRSKQVRVASSTVDILRNSGLKVVHAYNAGRDGGPDGDLEKSRQQLVDEFGYVHKNNYGDRDEWEEAKRKLKASYTYRKGERVCAKVEDPDTGKARWQHGTVVAMPDEDDNKYEVHVDGARSDKTEFFSPDELRKGKAGSQREGEAESAYSEWLEQKRARELAKDYLSHMEPPDEYRVQGDDDPAPRQASEPEAMEHWKNVGRKLKIVDRSLLDEWVEWSRGFGVSYYICNVLWDAFEPIGCDVHTAYFSLTRQTLAKILRPGLDYDSAAHRIVVKKWNKFSTENDKDCSFDEADPADIEQSQCSLFDRLDLKSLLRYLGIELKHEELRMIVDAFDKDSSGKMEKDAFLAFTGARVAEGETRQKLNSRCVWEGTCGKCGLSNAFRVSTVPPSAEGKNIVKLKNGEKRRKVELKERRLRMEILKQFQEMDEDEEEDDYSDHEEEDDEYADDENNVTTSKGPKCSTCTMAQWLKDDGDLMRKKRREALEALRKKSQERRDEAELRSLLDKGTPPAAPAFYVADPGDPSVRADPLENRLLLRWSPAPNSLVAFFSIEMSGAQGSREQRENTFTECFRDPVTARDEFTYEHWIEGLKPGTSYTFRIRAFNGFGPGPFNWEVFTTRPAKPNLPVRLASSPNSVTLRWAVNDEFSRHIRDMETLFQQATLTADRSMSREQLIDLLENKHPATFRFLEKTSASIGLTGEHEFNSTSLLDAIDSSDDNNITWNDFKDFLQRTAQAYQTKNGEKRGDKSPQVRYIIQQCLSETTRKWKEVLTTKFGQSTINGLSPGVPYRFRVIALNRNNLESAPSASCVVTTMLETPPPPRLAMAGDPVTSKEVKFSWDEKAVFATGLNQREQRKHAIDNILSEWTDAGPDDEGAVSVKKTFRRQTTFRKHPANDTEIISSSDMANILRDLGVPDTKGKVQETYLALKAEEERLADEAASRGRSVVRSNVSEFISLDLMKRWWNSDTVTYEIMRSEGTQVEWKPHGKVAASGTKISPSVCTRSCYKGSSTQNVVRGLAPNTLYYFNLRISTSRAQSCASRVIEVTTAPDTPEQPVRISSEARALTLKWYPGKNGAHKYLLEGKLHEAFDAQTTISVAQAEKREKERGWVRFYEGHENTARVTNLLPNAAYYFRVSSLNTIGDASSPSKMVICRTEQRRQSLQPKNADEFFTIECTGDVVVGDTILFTERLYIGRDGKLLTSSNPLAFTRSLGASGSKPESRLGRYVGERTIAASVLKDIYRSPRHTIEVGVAKPISRRMLRLEVIWSTVSTEEACDHVLRRDAIIQMDEEQIFEFETFRVPWAEEEARLPEYEEREKCMRLAV